MTAPAATPTKRILVLGASGLIGHYIAIDLARRGLVVIAAARRLAPHQTIADDIAWLETPLVELPAREIATLLAEHQINLVVNAIGALQERGGTGDVHAGFVGRLLEAIGSLSRPLALVHLSVPGIAAHDRTDFSRTKRTADGLIAASGIPHAILRPGFVLAPSAYGGSALVRALAALPIRLPRREWERPFRAVAVEDIAETVAQLAGNWPTSAVWDVMSPEPLTLGAVIGAMRSWLGYRARLTVTTPGVLLDGGARLGDLTAALGWAPPVRSTPLAELRRGVEGDPGPWLAATGVQPRRLADILAARPATVQERWFARLFLLKPLILGSLVAFWLLSGLIALTVSFGDAAGILTSHGFSPGFAGFATVVSSLVDIAVGIGIAVRRTARIALLAGIAVSLFYMVGAAVLTPDLWIEPLGALVKTIPAMVLMLVALATLPSR